MLSGKRILDMNWVLGGPFAGQLLAQLGAEVLQRVAGYTPARIAELAQAGAIGLAEQEASA